MTVSELVREVRGFSFRRQMDMGNFRELVYTIISVNKDPKKAMPSKKDLWPIPELDAMSKVQEKSKADAARALLDFYKAKGVI